MSCWGFLVFFLLPGAGVGMTCSRVSLGCTMNEHFMAADAAVSR